MRRPPTTAKFTQDDYKTGVDNMRQVGDIAKQADMIAMAEFVRASTFIATLGTAIKMTREAAHPNMKILFDCYHFWSGQSKFEDLDLLRPGDIGHVHFQDVPDMPRELLDQTTRVIPGDGVTPLVKILRKLAEKGYAGPLSVELFLPKFQQGDPFEVAREIRQKSEAVMRQARVISYVSGRSRTPPPRNPAEGSNESMSGRSKTRDSDAPAEKSMTVTRSPVRSTIQYSRTPYCRYQPELLVTIPRIRCRATIPRPPGPARPRPGRG